MLIASGTLLGPYKVGALIGQGGMGQVYRAEDMRLGRTVALKVAERVDPPNTSPIQIVLHWQESLEP